MSYQDQVTLEHTGWYAQPLVLLVLMLLVLMR